MISRFPNLAVAAASLLAAVSCVTPGTFDAPSRTTSAAMKNTSSDAVAELGGVVLAVEREEDGRKKFGYCNAVAIHSKWLLTARHCCTGKLVVIPEPDKLNGWDWRTDPRRLSREIQEAMKCYRISDEVKNPEHWADNFASDLALVKLGLPLPERIKPVKMVDDGFIVKKAPIIDLKQLDFGGITNLAASAAVVELSQYVPGNRFVHGKTVPMQSAMGVLGFDTKIGMLFVEPNSQDDVERGTSGSGVFVQTAPGEKRLLAIAVGIFSAKSGRVIAEVDVRPHRQWIKQRMDQP